MADVSVTPSAVKLSSTNPTLRKFGTSAAAILAGQTVYQAADGRFGLGDVNASEPAPTIKGIACNSCPGADQPLCYAPEDPNFVPGFTTAVGTIYVASNAPGGICPAADLTTNDKVVYIGTGKAGNVLDLSVDATGIAHA